MECNVVEPGYMRPGRGILESDDIMAKDKGPLPFEADLTSQFIIIPAGEGSILQVTQDGFPASAVADDFYAACEKGWRDTFESMRRAAPSDGKTCNP